MRRGFAPILAILVFLIIIGSFYFVKTTQLIPQKTIPPPAPTKSSSSTDNSSQSNRSIDTTSWKTIDYYNLSFKIPQNWSIRTTGRDAGPYVIFIKVLPDDYSAKRRIGNYDMLLQLQCQNRKVDDCLPGDKNDIEKIDEINGLRFISGTSLRNNTINGERYDSFLWIAAQVAEDLYILESVGSEFDEEKLYMDTILSTFKFID